MIKFSTIGQIEKKYAFTDAVAGADTFNGAFGAISSGEFAVAAGASSAIMQVEVGDNAGLDTYPIAKGEHVRVVDLTAFDGETIEIYGDELPSDVAVGDKLVSNSTGALVTGASAPYFEVTKVIYGGGVEVTVVATEPEGATGEKGAEGTTDAEGETGAEGETN